MGVGWSTQLGRACGAFAGEARSYAACWVNHAQESLSPLPCANHDAPGTGLFAREERSYGGLDV